RTASTTRSHTGAASHTASVESSVQQPTKRSPSRPTRYPWICGGRSPNTRIDCTCPFRSNLTIHPPTLEPRGQCPSPVLPNGHRPLNMIDLTGAFAPTAPVLKSVTQPPAIVPDELPRGTAQRMAVVVKSGKMPKTDLALLALSIAAICAAEVV